MNKLKMICDISKNKEMVDKWETLGIDLILSLVGNAGAAVDLLKNSVKAAFTFKDEMFWWKLMTFLSEGDFTDEECNELSVQLTNRGKNPDDGLRFLEYINKAENKAIIDYLVNATRNLLRGEIGRDDYFRICHALELALPEDLEFLSNHIGDNGTNNSEIQFSYSVEVQGLMTAGLMYNSIISQTHGEGKYAFTPLAEIVNDYAIKDRKSINISQSIEFLKKKIISPETELFIEYDDKTVDK